MSKYFNGFDDFDCRESIWNGIFKANSYGGTKRLCKILTDPLDLPSDPAIFTRKLDGNNAWTIEPQKFFSYSEDPKAYHENWLIEWTNPPECLDVFRKFIASVPEQASCSEHERFIPTARKVCHYLEQVLSHCNNFPADNNTWTAAGMYALTAFFLQNGKLTVPRFYCPPKEYDPIHMKQNTLVVPNIVMNPPEEEKIQFDFFDTTRKRFEQLFSKESSSDENSSEENFSNIIPLAWIWQKRIPFSQTFTIIDPADMSTQAFLVIEYLYFENEELCTRNTLQEILCEKMITPEGNISRTFLVESMLFEGMDNKGLLLTIAHDCSKALLNTFIYTGDTHNLYVSRKPSSISVIEIDENGHQRDGELETLLNFCGIEYSLPEKTERFIKYKKATSDFNPEYLQYLIIDVRTRKEISKSINRDPATGTYKINAWLPCPGKLITIKTTSDIKNVDRYAIAGYLHGTYGLKKDPKKAEDIMKNGAEKKDPEMSFEYGAFLRHNNKLEEAEKYLRFAAQEDIPGAQFELAELLKDRGLPEDIAQSHNLIETLWSKGYRTYNHQSIDLFKEYN